MNARFAAIDAEEVRQRSYGIVSRACNEKPKDWKGCAGTLFDPRVFGSEEDWKCACGKYRGRSHNEMICAECGVKIGVAAELRATRFGHINLARPVRHPLIQGSVISAIPVLPIGFREPRDRADLNYLYNCVLAANERAERQSPKDASEQLGELDSSIAMLFGNEQLPDPLTYDGRILRSLWYFGFDEIESSSVRIGDFLFALCLKVAL